MLSGIITVGLLLVFVAVWIWAWQPRHKASFEATARLAVDEDEIPAAARRERGQ
jgi:cytochrome c oxidase cbb3-type subunit 4